ncbi:MAG: HAD family hydrolase, partial [Thermodesulfobacteriota bacterium]
APDVYLEVLRRLNESSSASENISADECLVIEDSVSGIKAALAAGMKCLAVTNSYSADELSSAHMVRESLSSVGTEDLSALF